MPPAHHPVEVSPSKFIDRPLAAHRGFKQSRNYLERHCFVGSTDAQAAQVMGGTACRLLKIPAKLQMGERTKL